MSGRVGSITTDIIADGLVFNMDAANRASYPAQRTFAIAESGSCYNTLDTTQSGSFIADPQFITQPISASCWEFDGVDDVIITSISDFSTLQITGAITVGAWVKSTTSDTWDSIVTKDKGGGDRNFSLLLSAALVKTSFYIWTPGYSIVTGEDITDGNWHYVVGTWDGTTNSGMQKLYHDGVEISSATAVGTTLENDTDVNITIGGRSPTSSPTRYLDGSISTAHIYNRGLSASEILHNYNALKGRFS